MLVLALVLIAPVAGAVSRDFDPGRPFEGGRHRGVDFAAAPGTPVRAACTGRVVFAGRIGAAGIVTLRCGAWRVTHMPLATITARGSVRRGTPIGTAAASRRHAGLHLGVRRDGTRFGYADPLRFMAHPSTPVPLGRAPRGRAPTRPFARPPTGPRLVPRPRLVRPPPAGSLPPAPWPAWAGLALVLAGAGAGGLAPRPHAYSNPFAGGAARSLGGVTALLVGFGLGFLVAAQLAPRLLRAVDGIAGAGVLGFGALLAYRTLRDDRKEPAVPIVTVLQSPRDLERKRRLVAGITEAFIEAYDVSPEHVQVYIHEVSDENWAKSGKLAVDR